MGAHGEIGERLSAEGPRRHARWDGPLFDELWQGPALTLARATEGQPGAERLIEAYGLLLVEAIGLGYLDRPSAAYLTGEPAKAAQPPAGLTYLGLLLARVVPRSFAPPSPSSPSSPPSSPRLPLSPLVLRQRLGQLAAVWNIGEGVLGEAAWMNRYLCATAEPRSTDELEAVLERALGPALLPARSSAFSGPFSSARLDTGALDPEMLPGDMHLSAPAIVCVHDRRRAGVHAAVVLRPGGASGFLGLLPCLGPGPLERGTPQVELGSSRAKVGAHEVALPEVPAVHRAVLARSGFLVVSAVDSQRLWVVESP